MQFLTILLAFALEFLDSCTLFFGFSAGFLGIATGIYAQIAYLNNLKSFGVSYFSPYIPSGNKDTSNTLFNVPVWKNEKRSSFLNTKRPLKAPKISIGWRKNN